MEPEAAAAEPRAGRAESRQLEGEPDAETCIRGGRSRQTPRRSSEGVGESLQYRQVHKRSSHMRTRSRCPSGESSRRSVVHKGSRRQRSNSLSGERSAHKRRRYQSSSHESSDNHARRSRSRVRRMYTNRRYNRCRRSGTRSENETSGKCSRRRRYDSADSDDGYRYSPKRRRVSISRRRSRSRSFSARLVRDLTKDKELNEMSDNSRNLMHKFLDVLSDVKGKSTSKLSATNVLPEFDPMAKNQTIKTWICKVEECATIYGWDEREIIHFALPKLVGLAGDWYQGLNTVLYDWDQWKRKLIESFPYRDDYAELLAEMLARRVRYGESLERYFYAKINLLNRCGIKGRKAVDCLLHGIDDRAVRVGAQAAQFREPEEVLKYLKTIKAGPRENNDKQRSDRKTSQQSTSVNKPKIDSAKKVIVCHNCNENGHKSFQCNKSHNKCTACGRIGHLELFCRTKQAANNSRADPKNDASKHEKAVSVLDSCDADSNQKYLLEIEVNGIPLQCHLDMGSQCTLVRESESRLLNLRLTQGMLPVLRGIGGHQVHPIGRSNVSVTVQGIKEDVEIYVVHDGALKYPVLLGHSFTEKPNITIFKTPDQVIFERNDSPKLFLMSQGDTKISPGQLVAVPVVTKTNYSGLAYVDGTIRGSCGNEHYLLPGEYVLNDGAGKLLVQNMCSNDVVLRKESLVTRAIPIARSYDVCSVTFKDDELDDSIHCGEQLTDDQRLQLQNLLSKHNDCFSSSLRDLGFTTAGEMVIELNDTAPVVYRPYRMSHGERSQVREMVQEMLDAGIVKESSSPYASPIVLVRKKTGERRLCVDYRALNRKTKKDHYPLPRVEDQLDQLSGNKLFISLDLASGYYQIPIERASQDKTAFVTPDGQFEYTRMPFGLVNAPSVFQRTINKVLSEAKTKFALVYMDDILIPARSFEEGLSRLEEVLILLKKGGLTLKLAKCNFFLDSIDFLGFQISADGIKPGSRKTEAVSRFPTPKNQHELRQFLGLASFFRRFVQGFAVIAKPLTDLLRKDCPWQWGSLQAEAFETIKSELTQRPLLALYDPERETQLHTDASKYGVAGILLQKAEDGAFRPVSYFSRKTTPDEQKFHSFELETLAVVASLNKFRVYLVGIPFKILTDCNALRTTMTKRDLVPRIARWWVQLQEFDCDIEYRAGSNMAHVDALSRNPVSTQGEQLHILDVLSVGTEDWITTVQSADPEVARIKEILSDPESERVVDVCKNYKLKDDRVYRIIDKEGKELRWLVPKGVRWQIAKMNHDDVGHFGFDKTLLRTQTSFWFPKMRKFLKKYVRSCLECAHHKGLTGKLPGELHPIPKVEVPFHTIHADHLGPFVRSKRGNSYLLVIVDAFTKYTNITPVRNTKSATSIRVFKEHISYFGAPSRLITDQGTSFTSKSFRSYVKSAGIKHILNAVASPRANGQVERFNRTILDALSTKTHGDEDKNWDEHIPDIQMGINTTVHKTTGKSPSELLFGFKINSNSENILSDVINETSTLSPHTLEKTRAKVGERIVDQQAKDKVRFDSKRKTNVTYSVGDLVSVKREVPSDGKSKKLATKYQGPYRISKILDNDRFLVEDTPLTRKSGRCRYENVVAIDKLKPWLVFDKNFETSSESEADGQVDSDTHNGSD